MWTATEKLMKLSQYRSIDVASTKVEKRPAYGLMIQNMYGEWLHSHCKDFVQKMDLNVNSPEFNDTLETFIKKDHGIAFIIYGEGQSAPEDELFHVALLINRAKYGVEYVDCMANPTNKSQVNFEKKCKRLSESYEKSFTGTNQIFLYLDDERYVHFPPQTAEQQFVGLFHHHRDYFDSSIANLEPSERKRMETFAETYGLHEAGDCIFWANHIASQLSKHDISAKIWFSEQPWFRETHIMKAGAMILHYVTNNIFASLMRCQKSKLKSIQPTKKLNSKALHLLSEQKPGGQFPNGIEDANFPSGFEFELAKQLLFLFQEEELQYRRMTLKEVAKSLEERIDADHNVYSNLEVFPPGFTFSLKEYIRTFWNVYMS